MEQELFPSLGFADFYDRAVILLQLREENPQEFKEEDAKLPRWISFLVLKPPFASIYPARSALLKEIYNKADIWRLQIDMQVRFMFDSHVLCILYPELCWENQTVPYKDNMETFLSGSEGELIVISSEDLGGDVDVISLVSLLKGWMNPDPARGRYTSKSGLRNIYMQLRNEDVVLRRYPGRAPYLDTGIHGPTTASSCIRQLFELSKYLQIEELSNLLNKKYE